MEKYGGQLLLAFKPNQTESTLPNVDEVHYLQFPNLDAFKNYRIDSELQKLSKLRDKGISNTTILVSEENIDYK